MTTFDLLLTGIQLRIGSYTWIDFLDILLVTLAIYLLFSLLRRSQAQFLVRGIIALALAFLVVYLLLPLPTFGLLLTLLILGVLVAIPITLQPELRRWFERIGGRLGFSLSSSSQVAENVITPIVKAVDNFHATRTGALIALEGSVNLDGLVTGGVPVNGRVSRELLGTIFFDKTPLHDGAVIIRDDQVIMAGAVLPLTNRELRQDRRLGTRHRAAVGISEVSDALVIVVSEETGNVSVAHNGRLEFDLDRTTLYQTMNSMMETQAESESKSFWPPWQNWHWQRPTLRRFLSNLVYFLFSFMLALFAATAVRQQTDPIIQSNMDGVRLEILDPLPEDITLVEPLPETVSVEFQTTSSRLPTLGPSSFQATVSLAEVETGANRVPVLADTVVDDVILFGVTPEEVDVIIAPIISETLPVTIRLINTNQLSVAYEIGGQATAVPGEVVVSGPAPSVERIATVDAVLSVANATSIIKEIVPLVARDADGRGVNDVTIDPQETEVTVIIRRRVDARDVGVRAVTSGSPPEGYWMSGLSVEPSRVTIQGNTSVISEMGSFVDTLPVDISAAVGDLTVDIPLDLPAEIQALNSTGSPISTVRVRAQIEPLIADLITVRPVELINDRGTLTVTLEPPEVELLLRGPQPVLAEIESDPNLVRVVIDALTLLPGESVEVIPDVKLPDEVTYQLIDTSVLVTTEP